MKYIVTVCSLALLLFIFIGGIVASKKTEKATFFSIDQTNWLRSVAILTIMFSHFLPLAGLTYGDGLLSFTLNFGIIGVAIFFLLSGYSLMISKINKPNYMTGFIKKRLVRLYIPFIIVFVLDVLVMLVMRKQITLKDVFFIPLMSLPGTLNWYLKVQLGLYIVFYVLARLAKNNNALVISTSVVCLVYMIIGYTTGITAHWYESVFAFPLGMLIAINKSRIFDMINRKYCFSLIISIFMLIVCIIPYYIYGGTLFEILFIFGCVQFVVFICAKTPGSPLLNMFTYLGSISLELYLVHTVINTHFISAIGLKDQSVLLGIVVLMCFVIGSVVASVFVKILGDRITKAIIK